MSLTPPPFYRFTLLFTAVRDETTSDGFVYNRKTHFCANQLWESVYCVHPEYHLLPLWFKQIHCFKSKTTTLCLPIVPILGYTTFNIKKTKLDCNMFLRFFFLQFLVVIHNDVGIVDELYFVHLHITVAFQCSSLDNFINITYLKQISFSD